MALNNPYALSFDGVDDSVVASAIPLSQLSKWTAEFWIRSPRAPQLSTTISQPLVNDRTFAFAWDHTSSGGVQAVGYQYATSGANQWYLVQIQKPLLAYTWYHIAATYDGDTLAIYLNGELDNSVDAPNPPISLGFQLSIGAGVSGQSNFFRGDLDEVRIWNYARSAEEIYTYKNRYLTGNESGLLRLFRFDTGSGNIAYDSSPNANHGTIAGASWVPGLVDLEVLTPPGRVDISATLRGSSGITAKADHIRGLSAHLTGAATATGGEPIRIRGLSANLQGAGTTNVRMNLIAALKASLQGKAALKSNMLVLFIPEGVYVIDADEIFAKDQPSRCQVVANYIEVWVNPLKPADEPEEVYRSKDPVTIPAGTTKTITIHFDDEPVTEPAVVLEEAGTNLSIVDTKYYAWGADVKIKNAGSGAQTCIIVATGKPLKVQGREVIVKRDEVSIQENGLKKYTFDNPFVQDRATAELIADKLLSFANAKRDIVIEWRGDPALELADVTMIPEYQRRDIDQRGIFYVTKQELEFDGGLRARLEGRKM